jgi:hypothetical protein
MLTLTHDFGSGRLVEYRRGRHACPDILHLEARVLRPDGSPYNDRWYPVSDQGLLTIGNANRKLVDQLAAEPAPVE